LASAVRADDAVPVLRARGLSTHDGRLACSARRWATACASKRLPLPGVLLASLRIVSDAKGNAPAGLARDDGRLVRAVRDVLCLGVPLIVAVFGAITAASRGRQRPKLLQSAHTTCLPRLREVPAPHSGQSDATAWPLRLCEANAPGGLACVGGRLVVSDVLHSGLSRPALVTMCSSPAMRSRRFRIAASCSAMTARSCSACSSRKAFTARRQSLAQAVRSHTKATAETSRTPKSSVHRPATSQGLHECMSGNFAGTAPAHIPALPACRGCPQPGQKAAIGALGRQEQWTEAGLSLPSPLFEAAAG